MPVRQIGGDVFRRNAARRMLRTMGGTWGSQTEHTVQHPPWAAADAFPQRPADHPFGFLAGRKLTPCTQEDLVRRCSRDEVPPILLVWTPEHSRLVPPGEVPLLFEAVKALARRRARTALSMGALNLLGWGTLYSFRGRLGSDDSGGGGSVADFLLLPLLLFGIVPLLQGLVGLWQSRSYTPEVAANEASATRYAAWVATRRATLTWLLAAAIVLITAIQYWRGIETSVAAAGLVKPAVRQGQVWRMITGPMLHGGVLHLLFNASALLALGRTVEVLAHWSRLALTFLASVVGGSLASLLLLPHLPSVGASGGLLGLIGFMGVLGYRRRGVLPPGFLRSVLVSIALIAAIGIVAFQLIDNAAHLGGLITGVGCGLWMVPRPGTGASLPLPAGGGLRLLAVISTAVLLASAATAAGLVAMS